MQLYFIRHGEAQHNIDFTLYGSEAFYYPRNRFSPLTTKGIIQSIKLAEERPDVDLVITSCLPRTLLTSQIVFGNVEKLPIYVSDLVRETNFHHPCNERRSMSEINMSYPSFDLSNLKHDKDIIFQSGQDNLEERCRELTQWLCLLDKQGHRKVAIVTHLTFMEKYLEFMGNNVVKLENCQIWSTTLNQLLNGSLSIYQSKN